MSNSEMAFKAGFLAAFHGVKVSNSRLENEWQEFKASGKLVPEETILLENLISWHKEGRDCRNRIGRNPYNPQTQKIAYTLHMWGWRDLRLALEKQYIRNEDKVRGSTQEEAEAKETPGVKSNDEYQDIYKDFADQVRSSFQEAENHRLSEATEAMGAPYGETGHPLPDSVAQHRAKIDTLAINMQRSINKEAWSHAVQDAILWLLEQAK